MKKGLIAALLAVAIVSGAGVGYFVGGSNQRTSTTTIYERTSTYLSPVSSSGLQLQVTLNSTTIEYNGALAAKVDLLNTLPENLSLTPRYSSTLSNWEASDFFCGDSPDWGDHWALAGFAVFSGHFTAANLSSAGSQLVLAPPVAIGCITNPSPNTVVILPKSDVAIAKYNISSYPPEARETLINASTLSCAPNGRGATTCGDLDGALFGYWDFSAPLLPDVSDGNTSSPYFHPFPPGQYTLVAEDQWNLTAFAYFEVLAPSGYKASPSPQLYQLEFIQESNCPYGSWLVPWAVMIDHQTVTQPPNETLPISYGATHLTGNSTYSTVWFSLPDGTYAYSILPNNTLGQQQSGNVTVDGSNVVVQVYSFITSMGCLSTTTVGG